MTRVTVPFSRSKFSVPCWKFCTIHCGSWISPLVGRPERAALVAQRRPRVVDRAGDGFGAALRRPVDRALVEGGVAGAALTGGLRRRRCAERAVRPAHRLPLARRSRRRAAMSARSAGPGGSLNRAAMSRIWSIAAYAALPGQSVLPTSRWVKIVGSVGVAPVGNLVNEPPAEASTTVPRGSTWSRPSRQPSSRPMVRSWIGVGGTVVEVADHRHTPGVAVEAAGVRALDRFVHAARTALEDLAVLVDQRVVGDVAPAQRAGVVRVDRPDDARRVLGRVVVAARGVVHDPGSNSVVVLRGFRTASTRRRPTAPG